MADAEIEPATADPASQQQQQQQQSGKQKKSSKKRDKPDDAVKLGCGGLFRRKKKTKSGKQDGGDDQGEAASKAPIEKPEKKSKSSVKGTVKMEEGPQTQMWVSIVSNSLVGTGAFKRAAACSLTTGGILACSPAEFTPSVEQVAAIRDNFANREVFTGGGFGLADTVYQLQEETGTTEILCGVDAGQTEGVLVTRSNTALIIGTYTDRLDQAKEMLGDLRGHFIGQGL